MPGPTELPCAHRSIELLVRCSWDSAMFRSIPISPHWFDATRSGSDSDRYRELRRRREIPRSELVARRTAGVLLRFQRLGRTALQVARKCSALTAEAFPPRQIGNPAAGSAKGTGQEQRDYFRKCVAKSEKHKEAK
jgi:hypothetical protein